MCYHMKIYFRSLDCFASSVVYARFSWYLEIFSYENTYLYLLENFHWYKNCSSLHWSCLHTIFAHLDFFFLPTITDNAFWSIFEVFTRKRIIFILILWGHDPINEWNNNSIRYFCRKCWLFISMCYIYKNDF